MTNLMCKDGALNLETNTTFYKRTQHPNFRTAAKEFTNAIMLSSTMAMQ